MRTPVTYEAAHPRAVGAAFIVGMLVVAGCDAGTGVDGPQNVSLGFRTADAPAAAPAGAPESGPAAGPLVLEGAEGTLVLDQVWMIVAEVELDPEDGSCDDDVTGDDDTFCADFEAGPRLVELPLDGAPVTAFSALIEPGRYDELEFEIEDLDDDEDDVQERAAIEALRNEILVLVPDWPRKASVYVVGSFQPDGGDLVPFRVFIEAEIEIELDLSPPLVVASDGTASRELVVDVRPDLWFRDSQGRIRDLSQWDYDATGRLLELELEMEDGFIEVEFDR